MTLPPPFLLLLCRVVRPRHSLPPPPPQSMLPPSFLLLLCRVVRPRAVRFLPRHLNRRFLRRFSSSSVASFIPPVPPPPPDLGLAVVWFSCGKDTGFEISSTPQIPSFVCLKLCVTCIDGIRHLRL
ncbi:uncharacterized protein HKW66_Vig0080340 [Vigna angularis]|uniref:Uncharacterized protein n=1 Tax=Phaseolus angularis TaxID=3914 RepID=A0A8T0KIK3_PHAAN|nr:uncharacterized protein HKW66_Vig0080340 [Vigna angularis]